MSTYLYFDGMAWPNPDDPYEIEWRLRYGEPTKADRLVAASYIAAYRQLIQDSQRVRSDKIRQIRAALTEEGTNG